MTSLKPPPTETGSADARNTSIDPKARGESVLDRAFTIRQLLRGGRRVVYVIAPFYLALIFINAWNIKTGGVIPQTSPFRSRIPSECAGYIERSSGSPADRTLADELFLRGRVRRLPIDAALKPENSLFPCLGFAVLGGLHDSTPGDANFADEYVDKSGKPIVSVHVQYHGAYTGDKK